MDRKTKLSVASVTSDDDYIYALYNGHVLEDAVGSRDDILLSNKLLVFDWEGTPCMAIKLDRPIKSITYDKKEHLILALGLNEKKDFALYSFPIKKYIQ
ncbi:MAG: TolB-like 6-bladed beta-propeller domain-containing protein [Bacteroides sp.]|nr:TolB-like 6-bladed beta-propeller domain-containing protein [Bacteroides sp.]